VRAAKHTGTPLHVQTHTLICVLLPEKISDGRHARRKNLLPQKLWWGAPWMK